MADTVDNRVVEMQFDNKQFENGVQTSLKSLDKLKKGLDLDQSTKSLTNLEKAGRSFSIANIAQGVETITSKFSALGIIGVTALQNITNRAVNAGMRIASALTIDPIKSGFQEYETQINAVQTILANTSSKGKTLEDVNKALDELNKYADRTIYNFTEMTRNIGTFTAAGVDLDTSVQAIKGIANLAAVSGSTSQQASTAMYQLSQALASGTVRLQDWNSVVNAGMGGQVFQDALKETARVHGIAIDDLMEKEGSFRETLKHGWLSSEILTETLAKFTGDLTEEQLKSMGYTDEQIKEIIKLGQTANDAATKVKTFTQLFDTLKEAAQSGWTQSWEIIVGDFEEAKELLTEISDIFGGMINESAEARNELLQGWKDLGGRTAMIEAVRNAFEGVMAVVKPFKEAMTEIFPPITAEQLYNITMSIKEFTENFKMGEETAEKLKRVFKGMFAVLDIGVEMLKGIVSGIKTLIEYIWPASEGVLNFSANVGDAIVKFRDFIKQNNVFGNFVEKITNGIKKAIDFVKSFVTSIKESIAEFKSADTSPVDGFVDNLTIRFEPLKTLGQAVAAIFKGIVSIVKAIFPVIINLASLIARGISNFISAISSAFSNAEFNTTLDLLNGGLFAGLLIGLKKLIGGLDDIKESATGFLDKIKGVLDGVKESLEAWQQSLKVTMLLKIAGAIALLSASLIALSLVDSGKLAAALGAVTVMFVELFAAMSIFDKMSADKKSFNSMGKVTSAMISLSTAILILSFAVKNLAGLDLAGLAKGLIGIGVLLAELAVFMKFADATGIKVSSGLGLIALSVALNILASAVNKLGSIDAKVLKNGLSAMALVLLELAAFTKLTKDAKHVTSTAIGLTILGAAMLIFANAVENMGNLSWEQIGKGLITMAGALGIIVASLNLLPKNMLANSVALLGVSASITVLGNALVNMSNMSWEGIAKSMVALLGTFTLLTLAMHAMKGAIPGALALMIVAPAIAILGATLKNLAELSIGEIGLSLLALAGVFTVLGLAALILQPLIPALLGLGAAILLLGTGCLAAGVGIAAFATGLSALAVAGTAGATALVVIVTSLISLIPMLIAKIGEGLIMLVNVIADSASSLVDAVVKIGSAVIDAIIILIPKIGEAIKTLLNTLFDTLLDAVPKLITTGLTLLMSLLTGIRDNISKIVKVSLEIIAEFIKGIGDGIPSVIDSGINLVINFINGMADGIRKNTDKMIKAVNNLMDAIIDAMVKWSTQWITVGKNIVLGLIEGVKANAKAFINAIVELASSAWNSILDFFGINSPAKEGIWAGEMIDKGLALGIIKYSKLSSNAASDVADATMTSLSKGLDSIDKVINNNVDSNPTITPVIDLTKVKAGMESIDGYFGVNRGISVTTSSSKANAIGSRETNSSGTLQNGSSSNGTVSQSFTQNIYSPQPVDKTTVYRQTKNLFSTLKAKG